MVTKKSTKKVTKKATKKTARKPSGGKPKIMMEDFEVAAVNSGGVLLPIANKLDVAYSSLWEWVNVSKNSEKAKAILEKEKEKMHDIAEKNLFKKINERHFNAIKFYLSTKGKDRGYVEKQEVEQQTTLQSKGFELNVVMPEGVQQKLTDIKKKKKSND